MEWLVVVVVVVVIVRRSEKVNELRSGGVDIDRNAMNGRFLSYTACNRFVAIVHVVYAKRIA